MKRTVLSALFGLMAASLSWAGTIDAPGTVPPYTLVQVRFTDVPDDGEVYWQILTVVDGRRLVPIQGYVPADDSHAYLWTGPPGYYTIMADVHKDGSGRIDKDVVEVQILAPDAPKPNPDPDKPDKPDRPDDPPPDKPDQPDEPIRPDPDKPLPRPPGPPPEPTDGLGTARKAYDFAVALTDADRMQAAEYAQKLAELATTVGQYEKPGHDRMADYYNAMFEALRQKSGDTGAWGRLDEALANWIRDIHSEGIATDADRYYSVQVYKTLLEEAARGLRLAAGEAQ